MPFKQGRRPCLVIRKGRNKKFRGALLSAGYTFHRDLRTKRDGEIQAWVRPIGRDRQVHVQEVRRRNGNVAIYAHTEPEGETLDHLVSAVLDQASFQGGAKVLLNDLRSRGWDR